ncbi:hypothetical protein VNO78_30695 [Psophocarpus tetragonolobus]|uniref:Uncharacterized protein n=1 Tax=Psophocarpus tetragonolobus TaxID=3891 RepID=A0AAN9X5X3_PSOTE
MESYYPHCSIGVVLIATFQKEKFVLYFWYNLGLLLGEGLLVAVLAFGFGLPVIVMMAGLVMICNKVRARIVRRGVRINNE